MGEIPSEFQWLDDAVKAQAAQFLAENNELDQAFRSGALAEFVGRRADEGKPASDDDSGPDDGSEAADVEGSAGVPVVGAEGG